MSLLTKICQGVQSLTLLKQQINATCLITTRGKRLNIPRKRYPFWYARQNRVITKENISKENQEFIDQVVEKTYGGKPTGVLGEARYISPLKEAPIEPKPEEEWSPESRRTGVIAKKIGIYPMWLKNGKKIQTTLLQVVDNHVIKYIPPEEHNPRVRRVTIKRKLGCLLVGAESVNPQYFTKEYCGLFANSGVMPKRRLMRFLVSPDAAIQPGTPLLATHFKPGDVVDIRGKTVDRGFQGVMKRWGFKGMPATHGVTKTHRRPGNIGSGGERGVIKGTKLPGHMGNRYRVIRGYQIVRINTKYNIIYVKGLSIPGELNEFVYIYDTIIQHRKILSPSFPTYFPKPDENLPEELFMPELHMYNDPTISFPTDEK